MSTSTTLTVVVAAQDSEGPLAAVPGTVRPPSSHCGPGCPHNAAQCPLPLPSRPGPGLASRCTRKGPDPGCPRSQGSQSPAASESATRHRQAATPPAGPRFRPGLRGVDRRLHSPDRTRRAAATPGPVEPGPDARARACPGPCSGRDARARACTAESFATPAIAPRTARCGETVTGPMRVELDDNGKR